MPIIFTKLLAYLASPMGIITLLVLFGLLLKLTGWKRVPSFLFSLSLVLLFTASTPKLASLLVTYLERQYPPVAVGELPAADVVVTLGGSLAPPKKPRLQIEMTDSSDRLLQTLRIYRAAKVKKIYLSGGNVFDGYLPYSESEYARAMLIDWGVASSKIDIDKVSRTTHENALETRRYLTEKGLINKPVILVTSALHMPRAIETFRAESIRVVPASTDILVTEATAPMLFDWLPSAAAFSLTTRAWHELAGLWYYRARGWAIPSSLR